MKKKIKEHGNFKENLEENSVLFHKDYLIFRKKIIEHDNFNKV